jgi:hypothetical protein
MFPTVPMCFHQLFYISLTFKISEIYNRLCGKLLYGSIQTVNLQLIFEQDGTRKKLQQGRISQS